MSNSTRALLLRMAPSIYGPTILFTLGQSAVMPLIPVIAVGMGAGIGLSGFIASTLVVGQLAGNLPAGWIVARAGERIAMLIATGVAFFGAIGIVLAPNPGTLGVAVFVIGFAAATFGLARHSFMTTRVPVAFRARALSLIGGSHRLGRFGGPFLAAGILALTASPVAPVWAFVVCLALTALLVTCAPDPEQALPVQRPVEEPEPRTAGIRAAVRHNRAPLARIGGSAAILSGLRTTKDVLLPLWAVSIGMDPAGVALVVGIAGTVDFALFYTSGQVMDRFGRLWAALPATIGMAVAFLGLSLTHDSPDALTWLLICAVVIGIGNGLSSGIVLTLGADLAPPGDPSAFLAAWRTLVDFGGATAPLAISAIAAASLPLAAAAAGTLAVLGAAGFARWVPRYVPRAHRKP
ncbi:putative MFS family arabinose efflux permease [Leucobacter luti]|uniref:Putative MFS family arabinose efflux permease n=1 Tax=Leucobacter luti TaxID=340320 RepID=A0A4R6RWP5_9MICO|nr:MFS transporter [Leucobacter luti]TDP90745.1 putative MFS family arabinose efflux permease [Leucobacter luti]